MGVCGNVFLCVAAVVKDSEFLSLGELMYGICYVRGVTDVVFSEVL